MKRNKIIYQIIATIACGTLFCSGSGDTVAGGTGTGNPPVVMGAVALIADTSEIIQNLQKVIFLPANPALVTPVGAPSGPINISDDSDLNFTIDSAKLIAKQLRFITNTVFNCNEFAGVSSKNLKCDSNGIIVDGPFVFDVLHGTCEPSLDSIQLPEGTYSGISLIINETDPANSPHPAGTYPIVLSGTFRYMDTTHYFSMRLSTNATRSYHPEDSIVHLSHKHPALFLLKLQTRRWLEAVSLQICLDNGNIQFDQAGQLIVDLSTGVGPCRGVEAQIRENILSSGRLEILQ